jgi:DNA invertase Pin-like site-specific DNA recombinase
VTTSELIHPDHLRRQAVVYPRQSSPQQVLNHQESLRLQYALADRARAFGWDASSVQIIDADLGVTGRSSAGRPGFQELVARVNLGQVGIIFAYDVTRLARNCTDWYQLLDLCGYRRCLVGDQEAIYDPATPNGRLTLGLKGLIAELELHTIKTRLHAGLISKARRGELGMSLPVGLVRDLAGRVVQHPDQEVRERIAFVFALFLRVRSIHGVVRDMVAARLLLPRRERGRDDGAIVWRRPTAAAIVALATSCGSEVDATQDQGELGEDVTKQIDIIPARIVVYRHIYHKYACSSCKDGVTSAEPVANPIARCLAAPGLLAHVLVNKFSDHLPLYRQQDVLARHGMYFARSTLAGWIALSADLLKPIVDLMGQRIVSSAVVQSDDTPLPVLDSTLDATRKGYLWVYVGDPGNPYVVFDYRDSKCRDGPAEFLDGFSGLLQTDGCSVYQSIADESDGRIIPVGCWAHARRYFFDARTSQPREAHYVLALVEQLYDIEDQIRLFGPDERVAVRRQRSVPILTRLERFLRQQQSDALPRSQYGKAINYALNQWDALCRYPEDGRLEIDNNPSERAIRPCKIGAKNWLFLGSDRAGEAAAICMSIMTSAKRHQIEPTAYVRDLLVSLSSPIVNLELLLPDVWIAAHPEHVMQYRREESEAAADRRCPSGKPA